MELNLIAAEEYLASELMSPVKREYIGGKAYAKEEANNRHNLIASNVLGATGFRLRGSHYHALNSDTKIRIRLATHIRFYYPDASVIYQSNPGDEYHQDEPAILFEVLMPNTRRIDEGEKKEAYLTIPSVSVYALVEMQAPSVLVYRRTEHGFVPEVYEGLDAVLSLPEIGIDLPLAEIYEAVEFQPEPELSE